MKSLWKSCQFDGFTLTVVLEPSAIILLYVKTNKAIILRKTIGLLERGNHDLVHLFCLLWFLLLSPFPLVGTGASPVRALPDLSGCTTSCLNLKYCTVLQCKYTTSCLNLYYCIVLYCTNTTSCLNPPEIQPALGPTHFLQSLKPPGFTSRESPCQVADFLHQGAHWPSAVAQCTATTL